MRLVPRSCARLCATLALVLCVSASSPVRAEGPLPAFTVADLTGAEVASADLRRDGRWLLIYVTPESTDNAELFRLFRAPALAAAVDRLTVIVGPGTSEQASALRARYPALHGARWYVDADGQAERALQLDATPFSLSMEGAERKTSVLGVLPDTTLMQSLLERWIAASAP